MYNDIGDGIAWKPILTRISSFKFLFTFHERTWTEEPIKLDSLQSLFWLEKKQWYVGYDRCIVSRFSLLYSIPYFIHTYQWNYMKGTIDTKSTGPQIPPLNNVKHFTVTERLPTDYKHLRGLINLEKLVISDSDKSFQILFHDIVPHINLSRIIALFIMESRTKIDMSSFVRLISSMPHLRSLGASIILLKFLFFSHWPNIRRLEIFMSSPFATTSERKVTLNDIDALYHSFTHIQYLSFSQDVDLNPSIFLNNIPTTISKIVIYHSINLMPADFPHFITCNWLEQNTSLRHFIYSCNKFNSVSFWL